jgi:hypothetical protein
MRRKRNKNLRNLSAHRKIKRKLSKKLKMRIPLLVKNVKLPSNWRILGGLSAKKLQNSKTTIVVHSMVRAQLVHSTSCHPNLTRATRICFGGGLLVWLTSLSIASQVSSNITKK